MWLRTFFFISIGFYAARKSYKCNSVFKMSQFWKIWYMFWAFLGNIGYLVNYFIFKRGNCTINSVKRACNLI